VRRVALVVVASVLVGAVAGAWALEWRDDGPSPSRRAADRPCARAYVTPAVEAPDERLSRRELADIEGATTLATAPDGSTLVGTRNGRVVELAHGRTVLDLSDDTQTEGDGGLLGIAFDPDGEWLYVYRATAAMDEVVTAHRVGDLDEAHTVLEIDHPPSEQHHGGGFAFGPDGLLYLATGDGGGLGDPRGNAQRLDSLLGKVLRLDPRADGEATPEVVAYGLRNPFRLSFDRVTGDLWIGDVGQSCWEEIDRLPADTLADGSPTNLGWDHREGTQPFEDGRAPGALDPVFTYSHRHGNCAVVGGFVYRGGALPWLDGAYLFTDFCNGRLRALRHEPGSAVRVIDLGVDVERPVAIEEGADGEPLVLSLEQGVLRLDAAAAP
jgi:glucose/arabinose dehydrogenase